MRSAFGQTHGQPVGAASRCLSAAGRIRRPVREAGACIPRSLLMPVPYIGKSCERPFGCRFPRQTVEGCNVLAGKLSHPSPTLPHTQGEICTKYQFKRVFWVDIAKRFFEASSKMRHKPTTVPTDLQTFFLSSATLEVASIYCGSSIIPGNIWNFALSKAAFFPPIGFAKGGVKGDSTSRWWDCFIAGWGEVG